MGQIWGFLLELLHALPDVIQLVWRLIVHPLGIYLDEHGEVLMAHLLRDKSKVTTGCKTPAGVGVTGLVRPTGADLRAALNVCPLGIPRRWCKPSVHSFLAGLDAG